MSKKVNLNMEPDEFKSLLQSLDPLELQGLYYSLLQAKGTINNMITVTQMEVMDRVMSGEADPEVANPNGVTLQ